MLNVSIQKDLMNFYLSHYYIMKIIFLRMMELDGDIKLYAFITVIRLSSVFMIEGIIP